MTFTWPEALVALAFVPLAISLYAVALHARRERAGRFGNPELLAALVHEPGWKRHVPIALALLAFVVLVIGLARPHATVSVERDEATVILTIDTSKSMDATDVQPSRLAAAREAALAFLDEVPDQYKVGIVSFSSRANVVQPPTLDRQQARAAIEQLRVGTGTAIGDAIDPLARAHAPRHRRGGATRSRRASVHRRRSSCFPTARRPRACRRPSRHAARSN